MFEYNIMDEFNLNIDNLEHTSLNISEMDNSNSNFGIELLMNSKKVSGGGGGGGGSINLGDLESLENELKELRDLEF